MLYHRYGTGYGTRCSRVHVPYQNVLTHGHIILCATQRQATQICAKQRQSRHLLPTKLKGGISWIVIAAANRLYFANHEGLTEVGSVEGSPGHLSIAGPILRRMLWLARKKPSRRRKMHRRTLKPITNSIGCVRLLLLKCS